MAKIPSIQAKNKRTANDLLAELNAEVIDVEDNSHGNNLPSDCVDDADVLVNVNDGGSHEKDSFYSSDVVCIPLNRSNRTANDLLAEIIDVEENVADVYTSPPLDLGDDVLENRDDVDSQEENPNYYGNLDNAMVLNNKS